MKHTTIILATIALSVGATAYASTGAPGKLWLRDAAISPQGDRIAFTYGGDIWTVPSSGGAATRLTTLPSYEDRPVWSPDGRLIAFASDRYGSPDIFVMDSRGGQAARLTSNSAAESPEAFSPDGYEVYYSAYIQAPTLSINAPSSRMTQLYSVPAQGGLSRQVLGTPATDIAFTGRGDSFLYEDVKGMEDKWRKHHTSSVSRDVWLYDATTGRHSNLTARPGEDRNPVFDPATETVFFLSERTGGGSPSFNVYSFPLAHPELATQLTDFATHPVRFLSRANDTGTLAFAFNGDLYTMMPGEKPSLVQVDIVADDQETPEKLAVKPSQPLVSPDGKQAAFLSRGDVFVTSVEHPSTFQVTHTPAAERHLTWGADGRTLYYTSERSGRKAIYKATISGDDTPNFSNATTVLEEPFLTAEGEEDRSEYSHPTVSPDGKKMVYVKNRRELWVTDLPGKTNARQLTHGETYPGRDDEMNFSFSPDSRWLVMEMVPHMRDPYSDIALVELATGQVTNLTREAYFDSQPRFVLDGNAVLYFTDRYGLRSQASWGSQNDIMLVFLNRQAQDRFRLSDEDYALLKEAEKTSKKLPEVTATPKKKGKKDKAPVGTDKKSASEKEPIVVELDGIDKRVMRLSPFSGDFSDAVISPDGETLYALVDFAGEGYDLWKIPLRGDKKEPRQAAKMGARPSRFQVVEKDLFILGDKMQKLDTKGDKLTPVKAEAKLMVDNRSQRQAMYEYVVTEEEERFYDPAMHGVDWKALTDNYRQFLPSINNNTDFAEMLSELLGELNVSHTGGRYRGPSSPAMQPTATLGLLYDMSQPLGTDGTLTVQEVLSGGPFDRADSRMAPGARITAINGQPLEGGLEALNGLAGAKTQINFTLPSGEQVQEVVKPVSASRQYDLMYDRWVRSRAAAVDSLSNGRLGYVHISSMNDASFRPMYADLLGKYADREGVVIDIRWNGGGRMHEDIEQLFTGQKYLTQIIRGEEVCDMPSRRYNKPSVMLVAEPCYSNAHGTPWVYQHQKIGKVVGAPVAGTMTSVNWVTMQDPTLVFGIPVIGYRTAKGNYLENTQLEPDVVVYNTPEDIVAGRDTQLERAVQTLLDDIDAKK